ncbi:AAA family ATPase [Thiobaca trueperi]|uniref:Type II secretory pathway predicted ATPase ExeA n=1 Tax=Thiobaca trueperi TaxID=127458 RepID=A0A4R3N0E9_9GAMM|nr:AAA family ATPase [Thiobaca trueperi]TCT21366.1 type II secretory pathway predicted ATPase ExeA [Thiobaca trueperi]
MYESFFGLRERPFSLLPDPSFLFLSKIHQEALTLLEYGLVSQAGFTILTGEIGSGKTTLMRYLLERLDTDVTVGLISHTHQSLGQLMDWICLAFDLKADQGSRLDQHEAFVNFLIEQYAKGKRTLLIVDEAQNLGIEKLEELRLLSNINADKDVVLQLMLLGQPQLRDQLRKPELEQFVQRVSASYHLGRLNSEETYKYIRHRIRVAGGEAEIFTSDACHGVYHYSKGIPRIINLICDAALVYAYGAGENIIYGEAIDEFVKSHAPHLLISFETEERSRPDGPRPVFTIPTAKISEPEPEPDVAEPAAVRLDEVTRKPDGFIQHPSPEEKPASTPDLPAPPESGMQTTSRAMPVDSHAQQPPAAAPVPERRPIPLIAIATAVSISFALILWYGLKDSPPNSIDPPAESIKPISTESAQVATDLQNQTQDPLASETREDPVDVATKNSPMLEQMTAPVHAPTPSDQPAHQSVDALDTGPDAPVDPNPIAEDIEEAPISASAAPDQTTGNHAENQVLTPSDAIAVETPVPASSISAVTAPSATTEASSTTDESVTDQSADGPVTPALPESKPMADLEQKIKDFSIALTRTDDSHLKVDFADAIQFADGSVQLNEKSKTILKQFAELLLEFDHVQAKVIGHTDSMGGGEINRRLSEKRANEVARFLASNGVPTDRLTHEGMGKTQLKVTREQEQRLGSWVNRRIEIDLTEPDSP